MDAITYALCAGRHTIVIDGEDITNKSVYPGTVESPLDFKTNTKTAVDFLASIKELQPIGLDWEARHLADAEPEDVYQEYPVFRLVVTGLTPCLHAFLKAWMIVCTPYMTLLLGHFDRDTGTYVWDQFFGEGDDSEE